MHLFISHSCAINEYGIQRRMKDVCLGTLRDSWRTIRIKRLLGRLEEGRGNRKETEMMNGTFNISSCAQAIVCQPPYPRRHPRPILRPRFLPSFVLVRGTPPAVSSVAVRIGGSYEPVPNVLRRIFCASSNIAFSISRRGRAAHMEEREMHQISAQLWWKSCNGGNSNWTNSVRRRELLHLVRITIFGSKPH
jgi:hypothetical protein